MRDGTITFRLVFIVNVLCEGCQHQNEETEKEKRGQRFCGVNCQVLLSSADSTKFKECCFANEIDMLFRGDIFACIIIIYKGPGRYVAKMHVTISEHTGQYCRSREHG